MSAPVSSLITSVTPATFSLIETNSVEAIAWFDTARHVSELANTEFSFTITRLSDKRIVTTLVNDLPTTTTGWYSEIIDTYTLSRAGGPAYDSLLETLNLRSLMIAQDPDFPTVPTASLPVDMIIKVSDLTTEIFPPLAKISADDVIDSITLNVRLLDISETCIKSRIWKCL